MKPSYVFVLALWCSCDSSSGLPPTPGRSAADLASPSRDMSQPAPSTAFCAGTKVDGTCAQPFFAAVAACFAPIGASCTQQITPNSDGTFTEDTCWSTGLHRHVFADANTSTTNSTWTNAAGTVCLSTANATEMGMYLANGQSLDYDVGTGVLVCPDGTTTNIGTADGGDLCSDVALILSNVCTSGTCSAL